MVFGFVICESSLSHIPTLVTQKKVIFVVDRHRKVFLPHGPCMTLGITKIVCLAF